MSGLITRDDYHIDCVYKPYITSCNTRGHFKSCGLQRGKCNIIWVIPQTSNVLRPHITWVVKSDFPPNADLIRATLDCGRFLKVRPNKTL